MQASSLSENGQLFYFNFNKYIIILLLSVFVTLLTFYQRAKTPCTYMRAEQDWLKKMAEQTTTTTTKNEPSPEKLNVHQKVSK